MSGILWKEMVSQGMARSRSEVTRMVKSKQVQVSRGKDFNFAADCDDLDLPGLTFISTGKHMFRLAHRSGADGFDQLRCWGEIPVTPPEATDGCIHIKVSELVD